MNRLTILLVFICSWVLSGACQKAEPNNIAPIISSYGVPPETATLVIKRLSDGKVWGSNLDRAAISYIPASTSKIPHTLIALETEESNLETVFKWDGQERWLKSWNQDQTLRQAYKRSTVWVYQEIAHSLGSEIMADWLARFGYGNHNIGTSGNITTYWLSGPLEISALEQVSFLTKLSQKEFPLSPVTYENARTIFEDETIGGHTLFSKTGWMHDDEVMDIGWFVGWVETEHNSEIYAFAFNMDMPHQDDYRKRKPIVMDALKHIGAWPE